MNGSRPQNPRLIIRQWFLTRNYQRLIWGIPAILGCLAWLVFGICLALWRPDRTETRYAGIAENALAVKDFETARVASQRLLVLGVAAGQKQHSFDLALALNGLGRGKEAGSLLSSIAPIDKPGYLPAHLYLAQTLLVKTNVTPQEIGTAERHLKHVLALDPQSVEANDLLGRIYVRMGQWELAEKHLTEVVPARPETALLLAVVARAQGDTAGAHNWAQRAAKFHREKVEAAKLDKPAHRLAWADATAMLEDYPAAFAIVEAGWRDYDNKIYLYPLGQICALWADSLAKTRPGDLASRFSLIQRGLECAPQNELLLRQLISLTHQQGPEAVGARAALTRMLTEGKATGVLHFALGIDAWQRGQPEEARQHFTLAYENTPQLPSVANNMAMILSLGDQPDLPRALAIIESVLVKFPNNPNFRETRGEILARSGRWREAVTDLEFALPNLAAKGAAHKALAEAYAGLGLRELAEEHKRQANGSPEEKSASR